MHSIDINCDLGESYGAWQMGDDEAMLGLISSASVACGFHAGSPARLLTTLRAAAAHRVAVGAHVAYPDLVGFGRRAMAIAPDELCADIIYQLGALQALARAAGTEVRYVKPHGALYNTIAHDQTQAMAVIEALRAVNPSLPLVVLAGSALTGWATDAGLTAIPEAFADRAYRPDGSLVPRSEPGAVIHDADAVAERMTMLVSRGGLPACDGTFTPINARTLCVHSDTPDAVAMARRLSATLRAQGIHIAPFV